MNIPTQYTTQGTGISINLPVKWCGTDDRDGDAEPWLSAPGGSEYTYINASTGVAIFYNKEGADGDDADWVTHVPE